MVDTKIHDKEYWSRYNKEFIEKNVESSDYLFKNQYDKVNELLNFMSTQNSENINRTIGIEGERGSGKSSLIRTIKSNLGNKYLILDVIDPSNFGNQFNILEVFVTSLFKRVNKAVSADLTERYDRAFFDSFLSVLDTLAKLQLKADFYKETPDIELLKQFDNRIEFENTIKFLTDESLNYINHVENTNRNKYESIVLLVDDIDLVELSNVYTLLDYTKRFLSKNVIVLFTYRPIQLINAIMSNKLTENKVLLENDVIELNELKNQTSSYFEKLIPISHRISMPQTDNVINIRLNKLLPNISQYIPEAKEYEDEILINCIYRVINDKTKINLNSPDILENTTLINTINLRGAIQLLELVFSTLTLSLDYDLSIIENNVSALKEYLIGQSSEHLSGEHYRFIDEWQNSSSDNKNYMFCRFILDSFLKDPNISNSEIDDELLLVSRTVAYNVSLGDVYHFMEEYKSIKLRNSDEYYYIYIMKILYSIEMLLSLILIIKKHDADEIGLHIDKYHDEYIIDNNKNKSILQKETSNYYWDTDYYKLTRYNIVPSNFLYSRSEKDELVYIHSVPNEAEYSTLNKILYTSFTVGGEITPIARRKWKDLNTKNRLISRDPQNLRFREYFKFTFSESDTSSLNYNRGMVKGGKYPYDPFTHLVKERYLIDAIDNKKYLFYSIFDLDIILRQNYARSSEANVILALLRRVNTVYKEKLVTTNNISRALRTSSNPNNENYFETLYTEADIDFLDNKHKNDNHELESLKKINRAIYLKNRKKIEINNLSTEEKKLIEEIDKHLIVHNRQILKKHQHKIDVLFDKLGLK